MTEPVSRPFASAPRFGEPVEVEDDVLWIRLPLPMALDHVNAFALYDADGWTIVDTGMNTSVTRKCWKEILQGPLAGHPVIRVILTHHHPDHVGMAGWFRTVFGAEIWSTRTAWLLARMLTLDVQDRPVPEALQFYRLAGIGEEALERRKVERPFNFSDCVMPIPLGFKRMREGDRLEAGGRTWTLRIGNGHAPAHATLWCEDDSLVIGGDQFLADKTSNIGVYPTEPEADPLSEWLESCERFSRFASDGQLILPGHKLPYRGLPRRLGELVENHETALDRLKEFLDVPRTAHECLPTVFGRTIGKGEYGMAIVEAVAHLNYLHSRGLTERTVDEGGARRWQVLRAAAKRDLRSGGKGNKHQGRVLNH